MFAAHMASITSRPVGKKVLLMGTCLCDAFFDDVAQATVEVLEHLGVEVVFPENQTCCGQPAFNSGDWKASRKVALHTAEVFAGDLPVIVPSGSCAAMNFHGNLLQFEECPEPSIDSLARRTWEVMDYIVHGLGITKWEGTLAEPLKIAFHRSCHSRGTCSGESTRTLLSSIANATLLPFGQSEQCCGFGGTFAVNEEAVSILMGADRVADHLNAGAEVMTATDSSCLMHMEGIIRRRGLPLRTMHIAQILAGRAIDVGRGAPGK